MFNKNIYFRKKNNNLNYVKKLIILNKLFFIINVFSYEYI
jgi:hypothetical protein